MPQIITKGRSQPAALTRTARRWLPSRWTGASRSGMLHLRPRCSPSPGEEGLWGAWQRAAAGRWEGPQPRPPAMGLQPSACILMGHLQLGHGRQKEAGEGGRVGGGQWGRGNHQLRPVGWAGLQVHSFQCEATLENLVQSPSPKCDLLVSPVTWRRF